MKTKLLLIRHGETAWNAEHRIQGQLDIPLSPLGILQSARLAECLANEPIDAVYSSGQSRAWLTAAPLAARLGLEVIAEPRLRERSFGIFEGLTLDEIAERYPAEFMKWRERDPAWRPEGGESGQQLIDRVMSAVTDIGTACESDRRPRIARRRAGRRLSRGACAAMACAARASDAQCSGQSTDGVCFASARMALSIDLWGDVAHLQEVAR